MFRFLIRSGTIALLVLSLSASAQAMPLTGETEGFRFSLSEIWESLVTPLVSLWTGGDSRGTCDPNGGNC
ncbi:MAG TPA: hypothetical protein VEW48_10270 [Thermoanaerobaculia bacterium]|nr:hypothetical protein [Thermoanaerobaculia bacterium]